MPGTAKKVARSDQLCRNLERTVLPRVHHTVVDFLFHRCFFLQFAHSMEGLTLCGWAVEAFWCWQHDKN